MAAKAAAAVGLAVPTAAEAVPALQRVLMSGGAHPAVLVTALHPMVPLVQRMLLGLCRRKGVRVMALDPLGGAEAAETVQTAAAAATGSMLNPELEGSAVFQASAAMLLAWSVAREVIALPAAAEGTPVAEVVALAAAFPPLPLEARAALDTLAPPNGPISRRIRAAAFMPPRCRPLAASHFAVPCCHMPHAAARSPPPHSPQSAAHGLDGGVWLQGRRWTLGRGGGCRQTTLQTGMRCS